jgi:hypothetical protein
MRIEELLDQFTSLAEQAQTLTFITRAKELQEEAATALDAFLKVCSVEKAARVDDHNEDHANLILGIEFICASLIAELRMYLSLKKDRPDDAWNELINAQNNLAFAARSHASLQHVTNNFRKLLMIEQLVFPPQSFMSIGSIVRSEECSICGRDYRICEHIVGKPYMGQLCAISVKDVEVEEVSWVDEPGDKRCRTVYFSEQSLRRNMMTWRLE